MKRHNKLSKILLELIIISNITVFCLLVNAQNAIAQDTKTKNLNTLEEVFKYIDKNSKYSVFYNSDKIDIKKSVSINTNNKSIENILNLALKNSGFTYKYVDHQIVIYSKTDNQKPTEKQIIKGTVSDDTGETVPGVNIIIKDTNIGTITDINGNYTIKIDNLNQTLIFSFIGLKTQTVPVNGRTTINVVLQSETEKLSEVVVVGYSTQKKANITGSIATINTDDLTKRNVPDITQAMQGLASGVEVTQNSGAPGAGVQVNIRGLGSVTGENNPLYIVDGVPTKDGMNNLSPSDIKSISVLKDAASAAIYGSRANNGVVLITTYKGKKNQDAKIVFNSNIGIQKHGALTKMVDKYEYSEIYNEAADYFNNSDKIYGHLDLYRKKVTDEILNNTPNINHLESIFKTAILNNYHLGISGGSEKTQYSISGSYFGQEGILVGSDYEKITGKISIVSDVKKWLSLGADINISKSETDIVGNSGDGYGGNGGSAVRYAFFRNPMIPIYDNNGNFVDLPSRADLLGDGYNPLGLLKNTDNVRNLLNTFGNVNAKFKINKDFNFTSIFGIDNSDYKQKRFNKTWGNSSSRKVNAINSLNVINGSTANLSFSNVLNFTKSINDIHNFTAILGTEMIVNKFTHTAVNDRDFADQNPALIYIGNGTGVVTTSEDELTYKLLSYFSRANYNYLEKYFFSALIRRDGSSRFSKNNRWGTFYSASLGWNINEDFFTNFDKLDMWKLRISYGSVGNQEIDDFAYLDRISQNYQYPFGGSPQEGYATYKLGNEDVQWETSNQIDIGTDIKFLFNYQLNISIDYYRKTTNHLLLSVSIPSSAGYAESPIINTGSVLNSGLELSVEYKKYFSKDFSFHANVNAALLHNEMLELDNPILAGRIDNGVYATKTEEGYPIGSFYLYEMEGIFQNQTEIVTHAFQGNGIEPGDVKFKDQNNDGVIDTKDRKHLGSSIPKVTTGLSLGFNYKQLDFSMFIGGAFGQKIYYQIATDIEGFYRPFNLTQRYYDERWTGEGTSNTQPRASWEAKSNNVRPSSRFLEDASYLKLKNIQIGYNFSDDVLKKIRIDNLRIYLSGTNLYTFTKYPGLDPELTTSDNTLRSGEPFRVNGIDWGTYPSAFTVTFGLQVTF
ncbi:MAG: TonB-dependent receptor [Bacteroidetes bacterium]|nr:TonB-dependent receptor [Bacteroidota bacterium]